MPMNPRGFNPFGVDNRGAPRNSNGDNGGAMREQMLARRDARRAARASRDNDAGPEMPRPPVALPPVAQTQGNFGNMKRVAPPIVRPPTMRPPNSIPPNSISPGPMAIDTTMAEGGAARNSKKKKMYAEGGRVVAGKPPVRKGHNIPATIPGDKRGGIKKVLSSTATVGPAFLRNDKVSSRIDPMKRAAPGKGGKLPKAPKPVCVR